MEPLYRQIGIVAIKCMKKRGTRLILVVRRVLFYISTPFVLIFQIVYTVYKLLIGVDA